MNEHVYEQAFNPDDLSRLFIQRLNDGDVDGLLLLYETDAVVVTDAGKVARDTESRRELLEFMVYDMVMQSLLFSSDISPFLYRDNLALTSRRFHVTFTRSENQSITRDGITSQVAHRQSNETWLFIMTQTSLDVK